MGKNLISVGELEHTSFTGTLGERVMRICKEAPKALKATIRIV